MEKENPPITVEIAEKRLRELMADMQSKGMSTDWSEDLWAAYQEYVTEHEDFEEEIMQAFYKISQDIISGKGVPTGLGVLFDEVFYCERCAAWKGIHEESKQEITLPSWTRRFKSIAWDEDAGDFIGHLNEPRIGGVNVLTGGK